MAMWPFARRAVPVISLEERIAVALNRTGTEVPFGAGGWAAPDPRPLVTVRQHVWRDVDPDHLDKMVAAGPGLFGFDYALRFDPAAWGLAEPRAVLRELTLRSEVTDAERCDVTFLLRVVQGTTPARARLIGVSALYTAARALHPGAA